MSVLDLQSETKDKFVDQHQEKFGIPNLNESALLAGKRLIDFFRNEEMELRHQTCMHEKIIKTECGQNLKNCETAEKLDQHSRESRPIELIYLEAKYNKLNNIGNGVFGTVWKGKCRIDGQFYAIKCFVAWGPLLVGQGGIAPPP